MRQKWAELEARLERHRHPPTTVTEEDATHILAALVASRLGADDEERQGGLDDDAFQRVTTVIDELDRGERKAAARGDLHGIQEQAADWLRAYGYDIPEDSPQFRSFALRFAKASQSATKMLTLRQQGDFVETPKVELQVAPKADHKAMAGAPLLSEVVSYFLQNYDPRKPMYRKHASVLPAFVSCIGDRPVNQLKQMDIEDFCKLMCRLPPRWPHELNRRKISVQELAAMEHPKTMAPKTFEDTYLASVRPFLATARRIFGDKGFPSHLTTDGIAYRGTMKAGGNKQRAFKQEELRRLGAPLRQGLGEVFRKTLEFV